MSDVFSIYEQSLTLVLKKISTINDSLRSTPKERIELVLSEAQSNLKEADRILKQMDLETSTSDHQNFEAIAAKYRNYRNEYETLKTRIAKFQENYCEKKNQNAILSEGFDDKTMRKAQKEKLIENEQVAWQSQDKIDGMKRKAIEMENVSHEISGNVDKQGDQMRSMRDKLFQMNSQIDSSDSLLTRMMRRQNRNKAIIVIASILFTLILLLVIFFKLK